MASPNPLVGCVIVDVNGQVVGEGTYIYDRVTHAEVIALEQAGKRAKGGTAYVSLEPHSHHGKTPPCTEALINAGIVRVVCPMEDPNPLVSGRGFARLREAGIEVVTGILAAAAGRQNEKFVCWHKKGRPFVHLKLVMSLDGRISAAPNSRAGLSGNDANEFVQSLRHEYDAILIGGRTAEIDDPVLTDRSGHKRRRPLMRVVLDDSLRLSPDSALARTARGIPTLIFTNSTDKARVSSLESEGLEVLVSEAGARELDSVLDELKVREIQSVLVEGGGEVAGSFIRAALVDKVSFIYSPVIIGGEAPTAVRGAGVNDIANAFRLQDMSVERVGDDVVVTGYPICAE